MKPKRVVIVGGGIVGLSTAFRMLERVPEIHVRVCEKESGPGLHQTGHNSGVLHCGLSYKPGSAKARLAVQGIRKMVEFCTQYNVPYELCGKVIIAAAADEVPGLCALFQQGGANGLEGLRMLGPEEIRELEPNASGVAGLHVPQEGIVDFTSVAEALMREIRRNGGKVCLSTRVVHLKAGKSWTIFTSNGEYEADFIINCAGLQCDRVSYEAGVRDSAKIVPFRGEYYKLVPSRNDLVRSLIYPVPDPRFPFLGVHLTRLIHGGIEAGPSAVIALAREGYRRGDFSLRDTVETLTYRGFWRFLMRHPSMCWHEFLQSYSREFFCRCLQRLVPVLRAEDLSPGGSGVRAQALSPSGDLMQDFHIVRQARALHVLNAPSPAATASLALADEIVDIAEVALAF